MQFYIINKDPAINAGLLPDYAIKSVNVRDGHQILSDIGHRFGVQWEGQNKPYNPFHPLTREFSHQDTFKWFVEHFDYCCVEYQHRFKKTRQEIESFKVFTKFDIIMEVLPLNREQETIHYLLTRKKDKLTANELNKLWASQDLV